MHWRKVALVGVGLLGGSIGLGLRRRALADEVWGVVRREVAIAECVAAGAVDQGTTHLEEAVRGADLVVLCTPVAQMASIAARLAPFLAPGALVTDVGSVKEQVVREVAPIVASARADFVGSHPMAGSERTGVNAAYDGLFHEAVCVLTPVASTPAPAVSAAHGLWVSLGGRVINLSPAVHDGLVAMSSHLPHITAAALVRAVLSAEGGGGPGLLCASGFRDTTRVASGSPEMWRDIVLANRGEIINATDRLGAELVRFRELLAAGDSGGLLGFFEQARDLRDGWIRNRHTPPASPPGGVANA